MKHTPGPWKVTPRKERKKWESKFYVYSEGSPCEKCGISSGQYHICVSLESAVGLEQAEANAKLIAAAPDLLQACLMAKEELIFGGDWKAAQRIIDDAVKKATE